MFTFDQYALPIAMNIVDSDEISALSIPEQIFVILCLEHAEDVPHPYSSDNLIPIFHGPYTILAFTVFELWDPGTCVVHPTYICTWCIEVSHLPLLSIFSSALCSKGS